MFRFLVLEFFSLQISEKLRPSVGSGQYDFAKNYDFSSGSLNDDETLLDANSEKEQVFFFFFFCSCDGFFLYN